MSIKGGMTAPQKMLWSLTVVKYVTLPLTIFLQLMPLPHVAPSRSCGWHRRKRGASSRWALSTSSNTFCSHVLGYHLQWKILFLLHLALSQDDVVSSSTVPSAVPATEVNKEHEGLPSAKPVEDAAQPSSIPNTSNEEQTQKPLEKGWGFFSYVVLFVVVVIGSLLTWWLCLGRVVKRLIAKRRGKDQYRRVDDEEKWSFDTPAG